MVKSMANRNYPFSLLFFILLGVLNTPSAKAMGLIPETSMLFINEEAKGGSMNVKNSDESPQLLYTSITELPGEKGFHLIATQPVTRVEGGDTQHVRFVLQTDAPLKVEHMARVVFEGIPQKKVGKDAVGFNIRQDLPVIIHPSGLPERQDSWTLLTWKVNGTTVTLQNTSPYVVRFQPQSVALPSKTTIKFPRSYILPGQSIVVDTGRSLAGDTQVTFAPVSRYGVQIENYTAQLNAH